MTFRHILPGLLVVVFFTSVFQSVSAVAAASELNTKLQALMETEQASAEEDRMMRSVIAIASTMSSVPVLPAEVERHMIRGETAVEIAEDLDGFRLAATEFLAAARLAPWYAAAHYNFAVVAKEAGMLVESQASYRRYLLAAPEANNVSMVERELVKLEFLLEQQIRIASVTPVEEENQKLSKLLESLEGRWTDGESMPATIWTLKYIGSGSIVMKFHHQVMEYGTSMGVDGTLNLKVEKDRTFSGTGNMVVDHRTLCGQPRVELPYRLQGRVAANGNLISISWQYDRYYWGPDCKWVNKHGGFERELVRY